MNVLLINPRIGILAFPPTAPLGLLSIATYLKERSFRVRLYDRNTEKASLENVLESFRPDAAGISVISMMHVSDGADVSDTLRKLGIPVVWGGAMATTMAELILREGAADYVVEGEGEITFHELIRALEAKQEPSQVKGIAYLDGAGVLCHTPDREFADLADLPVLDWSFIDPEKHFSPYMGCKKMMHLYCSKGCTGRCSFCINEGFHRCTYRKRPNAYVVREIEELAVKHGMDGVTFTDELFGVHKGDLYDLCDRLRALNLHVVWSCQTRIGHLKREDLQYMYDAGLRELYYGVESGSPETLKRMHKSIDLSGLDRELQDCREIGIFALCGFIIGFPDETEAQLRDTVRMMLNIDAGQARANMFYPIPGCELYDALVDSGRLIPISTLKAWTRNGSSIVVGQPANYSHVPSRDLSVIQAFFHWRFFFDKRFGKNARVSSIVLRGILSTFAVAWKKGGFRMCGDALASLRIFLTVAWYNFAYPGIRKKYGLWRIPK